MSKTKDKSYALGRQGIKYKLKIAFYLMSILPWLVCLYLVSEYILPNVGLRSEVILAVIISIIIAGGGFLVVKEIFDRILSVSKNVDRLASGDLDIMLEVAREDEVGHLSSALNQFTQRIRSNMDELKTYSQKTAEINLEINKRIFMLSNLLQISSLISKGGKLDEILRLAISKSRLLVNSKIAYFFLREEEEGDKFIARAADGVKLEDILPVKIDIHDKIFGKLIQSGLPFAIDREHPLSKDSEKLLSEKLKINNTLAVPVQLRDRIIGILGIGGTGSIQYSDDDIEILGLFAKQLAIALENDILAKRLQKLEIKDELTGLYNEVYIFNRLDEEIRRAIAYQRPCAFIMLRLDNFEDYSKNFGLVDTESALKKIASLVKSATSEVDRVARTGNHEFAAVLPEKNKRQAQTIADNIRKKVENAFVKETDDRKKITVSGSVSENPLDGVNAQELMDKAKELLEYAQKEGSNHIVIAAKRK
mgnify:CR=1 FL=1